MSPEFFLNAYSFDQSVWDLSKSQNLSFVSVDPKIHRNRGYYLESDIRRLWAQWFIEGVLDPHNLIEKYSSPILLDIIQEVEKSLASTFNTPNNIAWPEIRKSISTALLSRINQIKEKKNRKAFNFKDKSILIAQAGSAPRCWICGDIFSKEAILFFNGDKTIDVKVPQYIDIFRPKGLKTRHVQIEIDHIFPISKGGEHDITNFRLCCGWCNLHKRDRVSLYEVNGSPIRLKSGNITRSTNFRTIPRSFWTVRAMGLIKKCEHDGCTATAENSSLFVSLLDDSGAATPSNLSIVCEEHDKNKDSRYQLSKDVELAISERNS